MSTNEVTVPQFHFIFFHFWVNYPFTAHKGLLLQSWHLVIVVVYYKCAHLLTEQKNETVKCYSFLHH